jgi:hypothetical protein
MMYTLVRTIGAPRTARHELVPFAVAFAIAETFYKFGSFSLELVAFLVTWCALSFVQSLFVKSPN